MLTSTTLIGLACLISQSGAGDQAQLAERLTKEEQIQVKEIIDSELCLPENFQKLIEKNQSKADQSTSSLPTRDCFY